MAPRNTVWCCSMVTVRSVSLMGLDVMAEKSPAIRGRVHVPSLSPHAPPAYVLALRSGITRSLRSHPRRSGRLLCLGTCRPVHAYSHKPAHGADGAVRLPNTVSTTKVLDC